MRPTLVPTPGLQTPSAPAPAPAADLDDGFPEEFTVVSTSRSTPPPVVPGGPMTARAHTPFPTSPLDWLRKVRRRHDAGRRLAALVGDAARRLAGRTRPQGTAQGKAYSGPAHGRRWHVDPESPPTEVTMSCLDADVVCYRLARNPRTKRPARDPRGRYVYVPLRFDPGSARHAPG